MEYFLIYVISCTLCAKHVATPNEQMVRMLGGRPEDPYISDIGGGPGELDVIVAGCPGQLSPVMSLEVRSGYSSQLLFA